MIYKEVLDILTKTGFKIDSAQTSGDLEMLSFIHPHLKGEVFVDFKNDLELPQDILDGAEFSYYEPPEWMLNQPIKMVSFEIDKSISYMNPNVLDTYGANEMNQVALFNEDLYLVEKVANLMVDPKSSINFQKEYITKLLEFYDWVETFMPILDKHGFLPDVQPMTGGETTLFRNICVSFYKDIQRNSVDFFFHVLTWSRDILIQCEMGFRPESGEVGPNCSLEDFEKELLRQLEYNKLFESKLKDNNYQIEL